MVSMRDALKAAFAVAKEGGAGVGERPADQIEIKRVQPTPPKPNVVATLTEEEFNRQRRLGLRPIPQDPVYRVEQPRAIVATRPTVTTTVASAFSSPVRPKTVATPTCRLDFASGAQFRLKTSSRLPVVLLPNVEAAGAVDQCRVGDAQDQREVALGLDFGTSSVKVVIGDMALDKAFAVPFCDAIGLDAYLLPTRLYQSGDEFTLSEGEHVYRDLKLSFVANPFSRESQIHIVAFMALVIARARGWLFTSHGAAYKNTEILWKVSVGLPAANSLETELASQLRNLIHVAWRFAAAPHRITSTSINDALGSSNEPNDVETAVEVAVIPEIAAQIYGFVVSNSFDKKAANNYLMVDVGAGTVDSSLFHVKPGKGGKWDFEFYTTAVEPHGVTNLHRHRVNWWSDALAKSSAPKGLHSDMMASKFDTDYQVPLPEKFSEYFEGVQVKLENGAKSPDADFFDDRVVTQVRGKTVWRAWKNNFLDQRALTGIPFFLCGGGARMEYYLALEPELTPQPGFSWLHAEAWTMGVPGDLVAEGLSDADYDRISVAYGLSRLEVGNVIKAIPLPKVSIDPVDTWHDNYVDKDQC